MMTSKSPKISTNFYCELCDYTTSKKTDYEKHLQTLKHKNSDNSDINDDTFSLKITKTHICECGKTYKHRQGLSYHKKNAL